MAAPNIHICGDLATVGAFRRTRGWGSLFDTWLGAVVGIALYVASRLFAPAEEAELAERFGGEWDAYCHRVKVPWL